MRSGSGSDEQRRRKKRLCFVALNYLIAHCTFAAEPPKIERLFPPGGQLGSSIDVKLHGKAGDGKLQVWSAEQQLRIEFGEKKETAKITIPDDANPGVHWLRFYNEFGTTNFVPFFVGLAPEIVEAEPNNSPADAMRIDLATLTVNGVVDKSNEVDTFAVDLRSGQTLVAAM